MKDDNGVKQLQPPWSLWHPLPTGHKFYQHALCSKHCWVIRHRPNRSACWHLTQLPPQVAACLLQKLTLAHTGETHTLPFRLNWKPARLLMLTRYQPWYTMFTNPVRGWTKCQLRFDPTFSHKFVMSSATFTSCSISHRELRTNLKHFVAQSLRDLYHQKL